MQGRSNRSTSQKHSMTSNIKLPGTIVHQTHKSNSPKQLTNRPTTRTKSITWFHLTNRPNIPKHESKQTWKPQNVWLTAIQNELTKLRQRRGLPEARTVVEGTEPKRFNCCSSCWWFDFYCSSFSPSTIHRSRKFLSYVFSVFR